MIERIITDINKALDAEAYMAALSLVLTLPDICAKAEYGNTTKDNKRHYIQWYDEYIGQYEKSPTGPGDIEMPYLSGEVIYQLRCSVLHQGNPNIDQNQIDEERCKIDRFVLIVEKKKPYDIYADSISVEMSPSSNIRKYEVNIRRLSKIITLVVEKYYRDNKEKFTFFDYEILDWDKEIERFNVLEGENSNE